MIAARAAPDSGTASDLNRTVSWPQRRGGDAQASQPAAWAAAPLLA